MPATFLAKCSFAYDSNLPRDAIVINPAFHDSLTSADPQQLATDLANALATWTTFAGPIDVKFYDVSHPKPNFPVGHYVKNPTGPNSAYPGVREVALCLSFYSTTNVPSRRGRLYLPAGWITTGTLPAKPTTAHMNTALGFRTPLQALGGVNIDWGIYSRKTGQFNKATHAWVDNEWDTVRRRGFKANDRVTAVTGE